MRLLLSVLTFVALSLTGPAFAQASAETLADIRQELSVLYVEIQKLKRELSTTGSTGSVSAGESLIDRVGAIEGELQRLTAKTEELEFRIDRVVRDGSNRVGDLEFRLCELESDCDTATLGQGTTLGGETPVTGATTSEVSTDSNNGSDAGGSDAGSGVQLAVGEQADFDTAMNALTAGEFGSAAELFGVFQTNYPGSPLSATAGLKKGEALEGAGEMTKAARAYLDTFSAEPNGAAAPEALYRLGSALGNLGQTQEACVTLSEVGNRFPGGAPAQNASAAMQSLGCQ